MNGIVLKEQIRIEDMIYEIRGKQVILDRDLAKIYNVETKVFMQTVKRNIERFPEPFLFQLTKTEYSNLKSQIAISSLSRNYGGVRYLPFVLTEQGIMMISGLLKSDIAVKVNIQIIDAFVAMRKYISTSILEQRYINNLVLKNNKD